MDNVNSNALSRLSSPTQIISLSNVAGQWATDFEHSENIRSDKD